MDKTYMPRHERRHFHGKAYYRIRAVARALVYIVLAGMSIGIWWGVIVLYVAAFGS
jgi:hypothetical protein